MAAYLDSTLRSFTGAKGYSWMGNEPSIELPWEYDYIGRPYRTQATVREIQDQLWKDTPDGLGDGNDDLGAMSAWYVWSALGMYPMTPGTATLALGSPLFTQAQIALPSGNTLTINGSGAADNAPYVQSATWNGSAWNAAYAPTTAITSGGTLSYTLSTSPHTSWASSPSAAPPSYGGDTVAPPSPRTGPVTSGVSSRPCLDDSASSTTDGNPVDIWACNGSAAQSWTIGQDGTIRTLGKCLDAVHSGTVNGTAIDLHGCNGSGAQQWRQGSSGSLVNPESGLCLDDPHSSATKGTRLQLHSCNGSSAQRWTLPAVTTVSGAVRDSAGSGLCLEDRSSSTANHTAIQVSTCNGASAQSWTRQPDGTLRVLGGCLDASGAGTTEGTLIDLYACNGLGAQQWQATTSGQLVNPQSGLCLDDPASSTVPGTQVQLSACDNSAGQDWQRPA
jgi:hypothetical protein